jgi:hypothetical protein
MHAHPIRSPATLTPRTSTHHPHPSPLPGREREQDPLHDAAPFDCRLAAGRAAGGGVRRVLPAAAGADRDGQLLAGHRLRADPGVHAAVLRRPGQRGHAAHLPQHAEVQPAGLAADAGHRLHGGLLPGLPRAQHAVADGAVHPVHRALLDQQRHPHGQLDPAAGPQRAGQRHAAGHRPGGPAGGMAAVLRASRSRWPSCTCTRCS